MKILMTADTAGGVWTYAMELIGALHAHGADVVLATMGGRMSAQQAHECARADCYQVFESGFKLEWMDDPWVDLCKSSEWLLEIESQTHPEVIHINGYFHAALPWSAPCVAVCHSCVLSWWEAVKGEAAPEKEWGKYRERVVRGLRAADYVVAPSRAMLECVHTHYGEQRPGQVIPNARDNSQFRPAKKDYLIFSAGRLWDPAKNILLLDRVTDQLAWPVYAAGDCAAPDGASGGFEALKVKPLGRLSSTDVAGWLARASIYCLPARYEPFGLSVLEAALSGCALVLGDIPSLRENWERAALFVAVDDPDDLAAKLKMLTSDGPLRAKLAKLARKRADDFSPQRMAQAYMQVYAKVLTDRFRVNQRRWEASTCAS